MSEEQAAPASEQAQQKPNDKEYNFRALEAKYERQLQEERQARAEAERQAREILTQRQVQNDDDDGDDDEPYVDKRKLAKKLSSFEKRLDEKIDKKAEEKARAMVAQERRDSWIRSNPDFYDILQHAETFAKTDPELAETILQMPEGFERQKLVYKTIKSLGIHKPRVAESTVQQKVDSNRKSPYYQPSGIGTAPYNSVGAGGKNYSDTEMQTAYKQLQDLKKRIYR
jgi:hypothetical protein